MRRFYSILAFLSVCHILWAGPVDEATALKVARNLFMMNTPTKAAVELQNVTAEAGFDNLYIFNVKDGEGFVIVAGDDRACPVLAYSTESRWSQELLPPAAREWLEGYSHAIQWAQEQQLDNKAFQQEWANAMAGISTKGDERVPPLVTTNWSQGRYYNALCPPAPEHLSDDHVTAGCVAVAMAQLMKHWNYPTHGRGTFSYSWENHKFWNYGTLTADFENTYYDWEHMPTSLSGSSTEEEVTAVATLMYHCGISVQMDYNCTNTGASDACTMYAFLSDTNMCYTEFTYSAENALYTFWGYKKSLHGLFKDDFTDSAWCAMLNNELRNNRPLIYRGEGSGGHCFILDGLGALGLYHFNWGWGGGANGYYSVSPLHAAGYNFDVRQSGIFGIEPDGTLGISDEPVQAAFTAFGRHGQIVVRSEQPEEIHVYDLLGREIAHRQASDYETIIPVPTTGLYLVRKGQATQKVMVP